MIDRYAYRVVWSEEDGEFVATCAEFPSLSWLAQDQVLALRGLQEALGEVIADLRAQGEPVPEPIAGRPFSGKFQVRVPPTLHRRLVLEAAEQGVSLNRHVSAKLSA